MTFWNTLLTMAVVCALANTMLEDAEIRRGY